MAYARRPGPDGVGERAARGVLEELPVVSEAITHGRRGMERADEHRGAAAGFEAQLRIVDQSGAKLPLAILDPPVFQETVHVDMASCCR